MRAKVAKIKRRQEPRVRTSQPLPDQHALLKKGRWLRCSLPAQFIARKYQPRRMLSARECFPGSFQSMGSLRANIQETSFGCAWSPVHGGNCCPRPVFIRANGKTVMTTSTQTLREVHPRRELADLDSPETTSFEESLEQEFPAPQEPEPLELGSEEFKAALSDCFDRVALGDSVRLPALLKETQAAGISADDLRTYLEDRQIKSILEGGDCNFSVWRSLQGAIYLTCDSFGSYATVASVNEAFSEVDWQPRTSYTPQESYLSSKLRGLGEELSDVEACILDAAQTIHAKFQKGIAVKREQVRRIVMRYHQNLCTNQEFKAAYLGLNKRGLIRIENETFRMFKHFAADEKCLSRYACLSEDPRHIEFLIACNDCCGIAWDTGRNVSARSAVQSVIKARYEWTKPVFKKQVKRLIALGVIEEVASKGTTAFRLTVHATETLGNRKRKPVEPMPEVEREELRVQIEAAEDSELTPLAQSLVQTAIADADVEQIDVAYLWRSFKAQGNTFKEFRLAVGELVACGKARLLEAITDGRRAFLLALTDCQPSPENVPISFAMRSIQKLETASA